MLVASPEFSCSQEILTIVALLSGVFFLFYVVDWTDPIYSMQFPTSGYGRTTSGKKPILRSNC